MPKIALIGAGSIVFSTTLLNDMLATPSLSESEFVLMDLNEAKLQRVEHYTGRLIDRHGLKATVSSTTDQRRALAGADYVITMFQVGGMEAFQVDYEIPKKYGIDVCVGQCVGPGGVFRALRSIPVMAALVRDMEELCPRAYLLNYVNPMAMLCMAVGLTSQIRFVGLCHGVQTTLDLISRYAGVQKSEIDFLAAGINHMAWFLKVERAGEDLYPHAAAQPGEARVLRQREGARRSGPALRLFLHGEQRPLVRLLALVPQEPGGVGGSTATSRDLAASPGSPTPLAG